MTYVQCPNLSLRFHYTHAGFHYTQVGFCSGAPAQNELVRKHTQIDFYSGDQFPNRLALGQSPTKDPHILNYLQTTNTQSEKNIL